MLIVTEHRTRRSEPQPASPGPGLCAILYVSKAARRVDEGELFRILEASRQRNAASQISGVLLHAAGSFMQYLEGPAEPLLQVYSSIKAHPLHYGLVDLLREPIDRREFAEWSMACHVVGTNGPSPLSENHALLAMRLASATRPQSTAIELLSNFWADGSNAVAGALLSHSQALSRRRKVPDPDFGGPH